MCLFYFQEDEEDDDEGDDDYVYQDDEEDEQEYKRPSQKNAKNISPLSDYKWETLGNKKAFENTRKQIIDEQKRKYGHTVYTPSFNWSVSTIKLY